jgi:hypothetical protein
MTSLKTFCKTAAATAALMGLGFAHAQSPSSASASVDIYSTNFQLMFPSRKVVHRVQTEPLSGVSSDMWSVDYQKAYPSDRTPRVTPVAVPCQGYSGSLDIYFTDFQAWSACDSTHALEASTAIRPH